MAGQESDNLQQSTADMTVFVQNLLQQMQTRFQTIALDEMGSRIDELEQSINNLKAEMGTDGVSESKAEDPKPADES
ncbi:putative Heat shock factor binding 1 [Dioscorea sansibarensis]